MDKLEEIAALMEKTAAEVGVKIVAGDTKVAGKGQVDNVFITTTGIGVLTEGVKTSGAFAEKGDKIIVTGDVGRHGCTILLEREDLGIEADITSDCAPLWNTVKSVMDAAHDVHVIRDATRGGIGTVLYEIAGESNVGIRIESTDIPVDPAVAGVCGMLGLDPLYLANEGTMVIIALHNDKYGKNAAIIGDVTDEMAGSVVLRTEIGTETMLPQPGGELLPRIC